MSSTDPFDDIVAGLDFDTVEDDILRVDQLDDLNLAVKHKEVRKALMDSGEMLDPKTDTGRELHSQRVALIVEMRRRNLLD